MSVLSKKIQKVDFGKKKRIQTGKEKVGKGLLLLITLGLAGLIVWAAQAKIDEVARAPGQVIATSRTQIIQAAQNGVLTELPVREGDRVKEGQVIAKLAQTRVKAAVEDSSAKVYALRAALIRLRSEVFGKPLVFGSEFNLWPEYVSNQKALYERRRRALADSIGALEKVLRNVREELSITQPLEDRGDIGKSEVLRLKRQEAELNGQIVNIRNKYFQDAQTEMTRTEEELASKEQELAERRTLLDQTVIHAPMEGIVKRIQITTLGAALREGEVVMELVPADDPLIVEAKFSPRDVAFVHLGLPTVIKLDAYDYSIYGQATGEVVYISPDALTEQDPRMGEHFYYRVHVRIDKMPEKKVRGENAKAQPGMTGMVEVQTGKRTLLEYLAKPIIKTLSESFGER